MTAEQLLIEHWRNLSIEKQQQVIDFAEYLRARHSTSQTMDEPIRKSIKRRQMSTVIAGKRKTTGDIVSPIVSEEDRVSSSTNTVESH